MLEVDADPDGQMLRAAARARRFQQDPRHLAAVQQTRRLAISARARPCVRSPRRRPHAAPAPPRRSATRATAGGSAGRSDQRRREVPRRHGPGTTAPPARRCLVQRQYPHRARKPGRKARRFGIRAVHLGDHVTPVPLRPVHLRPPDARARHGPDTHSRRAPRLPARGLCQNSAGRVQLTSVAAAAAASPSIPKRFTTPATMTKAEAIRNPQSTGEPAASSGSSVSSPKYMR